MSEGNNRLVRTRIGALAALALLCTLTSCNREPFSYVKVRGKVCYEDGSLIPAGRICVRFISQTPGPDKKTNPPPADAYVDSKTGEFSVVTSRKFGDGVVPGEHKVLILGETGRSVPDEYKKPETTPLHVNTDDSPFLFKIRKP